MQHYSILILDDDDMDYSFHPNAMVSFDFSSLSNIHKSVKRKSRTSKRKIRMDVNKNALQSFLESERDFPERPNTQLVNGPSCQPQDSSGPIFHGFSTQSPVSKVQDLPTTPDYRVISNQSEAVQSGRVKVLFKAKYKKSNSLHIKLGFFWHNSTVLSSQEWRF